MAVDSASFWHFVIRHLGADEGTGTEARLVWPFVWTGVLSPMFPRQRRFDCLDGSWAWRRGGRRWKMMMEIRTWVRSCSSRSQRGG